MKCIAVVVARAVEPGRMIGVVVQVLYINYQRVSFPLCPRIAVVEIDSGQVLAVIDIDAAVVVNKLVRELDHLRSLRDLEWEREIRDARHARLEAVGYRIFCSILVILLAFGQSGRQIWNLAVGRIHDSALAATNSVRSDMRFDVSIMGIVEDLPYSAQVRFAI